MSRASAKRAQTPAPAAPAVPASPPPWFLFLERHARLIALAAVLFATARIVATYSVFSHTYDEPAHIGAGMEWLDKKTYTWEPQHPPLARIAAALGPWLLGRRTHTLPGPRTDPDAKFREGLNVLYEGHQYDRTLTAARLGVLPFFWIACFVVWEWGRRYYGPRAAALAVLAFTFTPPVLAHAGLATTDMALTAFTGAAFLCGMVWLDRPALPRAAAFGAAAALAVASKFSSLAFLPAALAVAALAAILRARRDPERAAALRRGWPTLAASAAVGVLLLGAVYRFSFHPFFQGIADVLEHNREGHLSYLLGQLSMTGSWQFFPVVLGVKTPLALLLLAALWAAIPALRARWKTVAVPLGFSAAVLAVGMASSINIGIRHILPVYFGIAILAAVAAEQSIALAGGRKWAVPALGVLALWFSASSLLAHPDYIPYFNELALGEPEKIVVDSDLEWGQDLKRLGARLRQLGAASATVMTVENADYREQGFPPVSTGMDGYRPAAGWTAVDITSWKKRMGLGMAGQNVVLWIDRIPPVEKVGAGYYLWNFPPSQ